MSGLPSTASRDSQATASPFIARANSAAWSYERFTTRRLPMPRLLKMLDDLFGDRARADDQRRVPFQIAENALGKLHASQRDRHGTRADFGLGAHALADFEGALKGAIQHRTGEPVFERLTVSGAQLAQDFRLAQHHRIEPGRHAKKMAHGVGSHPAIDFARSSSARGMR